MGDDLVRPAADIFGGDWFRREVDHVVPARERKLQLGDAPSHLIHPPYVGRFLVAVLCRFGRQQASLFDETIEISAGDRPGVALVLDEAMHDSDGAAGSLLLQLDRP